jgi:hypothetical protein
LTTCVYSDITLTGERAEKLHKLILIYPVLQSNIIEQGIIISNQDQEIAHLEYKNKFLQDDLTEVIAERDNEKKKKKKVFIYSAVTTGYIVLDIVISVFLCYRLIRN